MLTAYLAAGKCDFTRVFRACSLIEPTAHIKRWRVEMQRDGFLCVACILDTMQPQRIYRNTKKSNVKVQLYVLHAIDMQSEQGDSHVYCS